jgi:hypothetical protein
MIVWQALCIAFACSSRWSGVVSCTESSVSTQRTNMSKAPRYSQRSTALEKEAQGFCVTDGPIRSKAVTPTLQDIASHTFESYVRSILFDPEESSDDDDDDDDDDNDEGEPPAVVSSSTSRKRQVSRWNHGICKITLPEGFWDQSGIAKDTTARGDQVRYV